MTIGDNQNRLLSISRRVDPVEATGPRSYRYRTPREAAQEEFQTAWEQIWKAVGRRPVELIKIRIDVVLATTEEARHGS